VADYKKSSLNQQVRELKELIDAAVDDPSITSVKAAIAQFKIIQKKIDELSQNA